MHCFDEGTQEGLAGRKAELEICIKSRCLNVFKNQNKLGGQATTALFTTSPNCKDGLGAMSECFVGERDTTFPRIY